MIRSGSDICISIIFGFGIGLDSSFSNIVARKV